MSRGDVARDRIAVARRDGVAGLQDSVQDGAVDGLACIRGLDPVDVPGAGHASVRRQGAQAGFEAFRSEEHTSELQSLMRSSYAVSCLKQQKKKNDAQQYTQ